MSSLGKATRLVFSNRNIMAVTLTQSLYMFAIFLWQPFWSLYIIELGGSKAIIGALSTLKVFSVILFQLPGGVLADRFGRKHVIVLGSIFGFLSPLIYLRATSWLMLVPGIIMSSAWAIATPAVNALIAESLPPENRGTGFGVFTMFYYLFIVAAYPFGGFIVDLLGVVPGIHLGLLFTIVAMLPIALIRLMFISETLKSQTESEQDSEPGTRFSLSQLKRVPIQVWKLIAVAVLSSFAFQIFWSFVVVYCVEVLGLSKMQWSVASIIGNLVAAAFMMPSGFLTDRFDRKRCIILSQTLVPLASVGYTLSSGFLGVVLTRIAGGVGEGLGGNVMGSTGGPVWQALLTDVAPSELRGSIMGLAGTFTGFLCTPAPWVGGLLYEHISPQSPFYVSFALGMAGCAIFALFVREPEERTE